MDIEVPDGSNSPLAHDFAKSCVQMCDTYYTVTSGVRGIDSNIICMCSKKSANQKKRQKKYVKRSRRVKKKKR